MFVCLWGIHHCITLVGDNDILHAAALWRRIPKTCLPVADKETKTNQALLVEQVEKTPALPLVAGAQLHAASKQTGLIRFPCQNWGYFFQQPVARSKKSIVGDCFLCMGIALHGLDCFCLSS